MLNMKALSPPLSVRRLAPQDLLLRVFAKAVDTFRVDGQERFKIVLAKMSDVEQFLKSKCAYYLQFDEENHVVTQLGKSIINNSKCLLM